MAMMRIQTFPYLDSVAIRQKCFCLLPPVPPPRSVRAKFTCSPNFLPARNNYRVPLRSQAHFLPAAAVNFGAPHNTAAGDSALSSREMISEQQRMCK
jgi:hypothetical protein